MWSSFIRNFWTFKVPFSFIRTNAWLYVPRVLILLFIYVPNVILLLVICLTPSLRCPRNLFWCAVCCSDLIMATYFTTEIILSVSGAASELYCIYVVMFYQTHYCLLLNNVLVASWDRYMAVRYPMWHRRKMTRRRVIVIIVGSNLFTFIMSLAPYWTKLVPAECAYYSFHVEMTTIFFFVMVCVCMVFHMKVLVAARKAIRSPNLRPFTRKPSYEAYVLTTNDTRSPSAVLSENHASYHVTICNPDVSATTARETPPRLRESSRPHWMCASIHSPVHRLEIKAAVTITLGLIPLWLFSLPMIVTSFFLALCLHVEQTDCMDIRYVFSFVREIYLLHGVYNPLVYMYRSPDFRFAFKRILRRTFRKF